MNTDFETLFCAQIEACTIHEHRLEMALKHLSHILPFAASTLSQLSDDELSYLDMMTGRFAKLQDQLGAKIFPLLLQKLQEYRVEESYLDRLYKLEKLALLPSAEEWIKMRELRNQIMHEYPDDPELMAANLNKAVDYARKLLAFWKELRQKITK